MSSADGREWTIALMAERAEHLGLTFRVVPQITRKAGILSAEVVAAALTAEVQIAGEGPQTNSWATVATVADADRAANEKARKPGENTLPRAPARVDEEGGARIPRHR